MIERTPKEVTIMRQRGRVFIALFLLLILTVSCAARPAAVKTAQEADSWDGAPAAPMEAPAAKPDGEYYGQAAREAEALERMIIRTVNMNVVVQDTDEMLTAVRELTAAHEGYISSSNRWLANNQPYARITIRVPSASLDAVMTSIRELTVRVQEENVSGQDVTEEYVDLRARLVNMEAAETELRALMVEMRENRGKAEDILAIYRQLTEIRSQIESLKGRMQYLEQMTAMATLNLEIRPVDAPRPIVEQASWSPLVTGSNALRAFVEVTRVFVDLAIYLLVFSPFIILPVVVLWLLVRWARRRQARRSQGAKSA
jgi:hypothetical protein